VKNGDYLVILSIGENVRKRENPDIHKRNHAPIHGMARVPKRCCLPLAGGSEAQGPGNHAQTLRPRQATRGAGFLAEGSGKALRGCPAAVSGHRVFRIHLSESNIIYIHLQRMAIMWNSPLGAFFESLWIPISG